MVYIRTLTISISLVISMLCVKLHAEENSYILFDDILGGVQQRPQASGVAFYELDHMITALSHIVHTQLTPVLGYVELYLPDSDDPNVALFKAKISLCQSELALKSSSFVFSNSAIFLEALDASIVAAEEAFLLIQLIKGLPENVRSAVIYETVEIVNALKFSRIAFLMPVQKIPLPPMDPTVLETLRKSATDPNLNRLLSAGHFLSPTLLENKAILEGATKDPLLFLHRFFILAALTEVVHYELSAKGSTVKLWDVSSRSGHGYALWLAKKYFKNIYGDTLVMETILDQGISDCEGFLNAP